MLPLGSIFKDYLVMKNIAVDITRGIGYVDFKWFKHIFQVTGKVRINLIVVKQKCQGKVSEICFDFLVATLSLLP